MTSTILHMFMSGLVLLFPCDILVVGYGDARVTELKQGITAFYALFGQDSNPMFTNIEPSLCGFKTPNLFKNDRRNVKYDSYDFGKTEKQENKKCAPDELYVNSDLKDSSTCPWYTKVNYDTNRIPERIRVAICRCNKCVEGCCKEHFINIPVMRLYKGHFVPTVEPVSVACICQHMDKRDQPNKCRTGKLFQPTHDHSKHQKHERRARKKKTHPRKRKTKNRKARREIQLNRRKTKKKRSNVMRETTRELIWWRHKNCSFYRYCRL